MYTRIFSLQSQVYKALANPKRLEIIHLLRDQELTVSQMLEMLDLPQANLSQHLQVLRKFQVVAPRRNGKEVYYKLAHPNVMVASDSFREMLIDQHQDEEEVAEELRLKMKDLVPVTRDPVCGMRLSPKTAAYAMKKNPHTFYFCASGCRDKFKKNRRNLLKGVTSEK